MGFNGILPQKCDWLLGQVQTLSESLPDKCCLPELSFSRPATSINLTEVKGVTTEIEKMAISQLVLALQKNYKRQ